MILTDVIRHYQKISFPSRLFMLLRLKIAPFLEVTEYLPVKGKILEIGCGYGVLSWIVHRARPQCKVVGIDIDKKRIAVAQKTVKGEKNISFITCDITKEKLPDGLCQSIILFDVLHHIDRYSQEQVLKQTYYLLGKNGQVLLKEINTTPKWKYWWNLLHDTIVTKGESIHCRRHTEWTNLLEKNGFTVSQPTYYRNGILYPHVLIIGTKH